MTELADRLARQIGLAGPISVADFMAVALQDPTQGYYARQAAIGGAGDFITAPEISQVFGELIGLALLDCWERMGAPEAIQLVELGPGRATLMADALRATQLRPTFHRAIELHLVEINRTLRQMQRERLKPFADRGLKIEWHETLAALPEGPLLLIANEFFDALPVHQFERRGAGWVERRVAVDGDGNLAFVAGPAGPQLGLASDAQRQAPPGSLIEVCPAGLELAARIGARLSAFGGAGLIVDYGYDSGGGWSLQAVADHRKIENPLSRPGRVDLTAHVDFAALAGAARGAGASVGGPVAQAQWLESLGARTRGERLASSADPTTAARIRSGLDRLLDPSEMGSLFRVLGLAGPVGPLPAGLPAAL